ncbi:glycerol-3-phosphate 1-O-acyltransferase PlsY [Albimonas pacifica]|uniref:Glycerol-3-phosphate acyltransferase n=1 Tax=Albimonas pacifica TaxID=1114924 RepID=A0A1I3JPH4_9RHOB|nr:glycerol-3-phosphate 1-O-acyltransferase PlsY [Albimonas pacifica]SFI62151.1 acyl-phosphate glycerol-3-phosphate acyltransferase [Albimonas pacifica]
MSRMIPEWLRALLGETAAPGLDAALPYLLGALLLGYLLGSIPMGVLLSRAFGLGDLTKVGSGNIGATNVLRTGNKAAAALTLLLDAGKGAAAVLIAGMWGPDAAVLGACGAMIGHCFPVWLRFRGGKGVATILGCTLALSWPAGLVCLAVWLGAAALTRYSSVGGLAAAAASPLALWAFGRLEAVGLFVLLAALVFAKHHENLGRLARGTESKIGAKPRG